MLRSHWMAEGQGVAPPTRTHGGTLFNSHPLAWRWHHQLSFEVTQKPFSQSWEGFSEASAEWSCCLRTTFVWDSRASMHERTCLVTVSFQFLTHICILKLVNLHLTMVPPPVAPALSFQSEICAWSSCLWDSAPSPLARQTCRPFF